MEERTTRAISAKWTRATASALIVVDVEIENEKKGTFDEKNVP